MFSEVVCGFIQPLHVAVLMEFIPLCGGKLAVNYVLPHTKPNSLNPTMHVKRFGFFRPSSGTEVHNLNPKWTCVRSILQFLRSHEFYHCRNTGLLFFAIWTMHFSYVTDGVMVGILSRPLRRLSQYTAPILMCFSRHWAPSQHVHIGLPDDGILKCRNM
jgi:hypothetical protein